ncbi:hypothetical protein XH88_26245 [Bradyrhizobium sp. CCBAU 51627]|nr:hypothetical protein [Bradyrhizobium sp. CCBAU 51627]
MRRFCPLVDYVDEKQGAKGERRSVSVALLMLCLEVEEPEDVDDDRTSAQRFRDQQARWR